jgi:hypothetical protein
MAYPEAARGRTSYIDEHNRFILNGEPFFPLGLYVAQQPAASASLAGQIDDIANSPFDTLMNYNSNDGTNSEITEYLDELEDRGLKLIFSFRQYFGPCSSGNNECNNPLTIPDIIDTITQKVTAFKGHPAIIAWYTNDEVCPACLPELEAGYDKIRELDENHPVWSVHWNTDWLLQEADTTDIVGVAPYPIDNKPITLVSQMADEANAAGKPLWLVPQIFSWTDYPSDFRAATGRPPTWEEMRAMTYLAVNHGAKGLIYYSYFNILDDNDFQTRWPQIKDIANEIDQLRPVILSVDQTGDNDITCNSPDIDFKLMRRDDKYYLLAVNTKAQTISGVTFQINLAKKPQELDTLFEDGRQMSVVDGSVADDFDIYEVHVYAWDDPADVAVTGGWSGSSGGGCFIDIVGYR